MPFHALTLHIFLQTPVMEDQMKAILIIGGIIAVIILIAINTKKAIDVHTNKVLALGGYSISTTAYYDLLEKLIAEHEMPGVKIDRITHLESHILSAKRDYLRISRKDDIYDVCAAPFGTDSFVSIWHGEPKKRLKKLAMMTPHLRTAVEGFNRTSRFEIDTQAMFKMNVEESIEKAIDEMTEGKGIRMPSQIFANAFA